MTALIALHNYAVFGKLWGVEVTCFLLLSAVYSAGSWAILRAKYKGRESGSHHLGKFFLRTDLLLAGAAVYVSGGGNSWLYFLPYMRVADQVEGGTRWCFELVVQAALTHIGVLLIAANVGGATLNLPVESTKVVICTSIALYIASTTRASEASVSYTHLTLPTTPYV